MIPKILHYCWFGNGPMPKSDKESIESWKKLCPDYQIIEWNEENYNYKKNQYMREAYECKKYAFVADYARLDVVYNYGGIYLDTDVTLLRNIDCFLEEKAFCGYENDQYIGLGLIFGAEKNTPIIKELMDYYNDKSFYNPDGTMNLTPITHYTDAVLSPKGLLKNNIKQNIQGLTIYPKEYFNPISFLGEKVANFDSAYSIHKYHSSWVPKERFVYIDRMREYTKKYGEEYTVSGKAEARGNFLNDYYSIKHEKGLIYAILWKMRNRKKYDF